MGERSKRGFVSSLSEQMQQRGNVNRPVVPRTGSGGEDVHQSDTEMSRHGLIQGIGDDCRVTYGVDAVLIDPGVE